MMSALHRKLLRDLWRLRGQGLAIAMVVAAGIGVFVMSMGALESLEVTMGRYYERHRFADVFASAKRVPESLAERARAIGGVQRLDTRIVYQVTLDVRDFGEPILGRLISLPEGREPILNLPYLRRGRWVAPHREHEVLVNEPFAEAHGLVPGDTVDAVINGRWRRLTIAGTVLSPEFVYAIGPGQLLPDDLRFGVLWMGREALEAATDMEGAFNDLSLTLMPSASEPDVIAKVDTLLERYGGLGAYGREDQISNWFLEGELDELRATAIASPAIFLSVAAFLLNIVVSRLITAQREQVGVLKACGYGNGAIAVHYLELTMVVVLIGALLGIGLGAWLGAAITTLFSEFYKFPFLIFRSPPSVLGASLFLALAVGAIGTLGAVRQAVRLSPAIAMQPAAPPSFRRGLLANLGVLHLFTQPMRMTLRHIGRRPIKTALTTLGVGLAVAIMVASSFMFDSLDYIIDAEFDIAGRQDVTVTFVEPRSRRALFEILALPGVLRAEPYRAVGVKLKAGHLSERNSLVGLVPGATLNRKIDSELMPIPVPGHGLMISRKLAENLDVGVGQTIRVEALEGRRQARDIVVAGLVDDFFGTGAFASIDVVNRLMLEGPVVSGAYLDVDKARLPELHQELKHIPGIAGTMLREAAVEIFNRTLAENLYKIIGFNILFACMIAFGVIFNSARISQAERSRELASLRVIGFTRQEVRQLLAAEFGFILVLALPLGCAMGRGLAWLIALGLDRDLYRIPLVIERPTYGMAVAAVTLAALVSGFYVGRKSDRMDLVAVLKTRE